MEQMETIRSGQTDRKRVFVNVETVSHFGRDIVEGIIQFALEHEWEIDFEYRTLAEPLPSWFKHWSGDGIISRSGSRKIVQDLARKKCPRVELVGTDANDEPEVSADREEIARMIFSHFFERGFRHYAVFSFNDCWWSLLEKKCYIDLLQKHDIEVHTFKVRGDRRAILPKWSENDRARLKDWLLSLPKPVALYVVTDAQAVPVLQTCRSAGIAVPDDIAVVSVENDDWLCNITNPPLSSVDQNGRRIGYLAAKLMADRMEGKCLERQRISVSPLFIKTRQSSDCIAIDDRDFADIIKYIRESATSGLTVQEVVDYSNLSHATLRRLFHKWLGRTIEQEIRHLRIEKARQLLHETECSIATVAKKSGFNSSEYFCFVFRQTVGMTPHEFRNNK